jgi:hypothetical protein
VSTVNFRKLSVHEQLIVAMGVLMDGADAAQYLERDSQRGELLAGAASELALLELDSRLPFVGTLVRLALETHEQ